MDAKYLLNIGPSLDYEKHGEPPCSETDPEAFFPQDELQVPGLMKPKYYDERFAKSVCNSCPYKIDCLLLAIDQDESGIWGGTTESDRKKIRRAMKLNGHDKSKISLYIKR